MSILWQIVLLAVGLVLLVKGADFMVDGAGGIARKMRVPEIVIGMTIIAFGTSAPEMSVAFQAFASGTTDLTLGDVVGCAVSNILLLLGVAAIIRPIKINQSTIKRDIPFYLLVAAVFIGMVIFAEANGGVMPRLFGVILVLIFFAFLSMTLFVARKEIKKKPTKSVSASKKQKQVGSKKEKRLWVFAIMTIGGLIGIIVGSDLAVNSAKSIAEILGVSEKIIAMTILALGTSLPELATTVTASRKNQQELLVGNVLGSNIFNFCFVLGLPIVIFGSLNIMSLKTFDLVAMAAAAILLPIFAQTSAKITRFEGALMLTLFVLYYVGMFVFN